MLCNTEAREQHPELRELQQPGRLRHQELRGARHAQARLGGVAPAVLRYRLIGLIRVEGLHRARG